MSKRELLSKSELNALNQYYLFGYWKNRGSMKLIDRKQLIKKLYSLKYINNNGLTVIGRQYCLDNR